MIIDDYGIQLTDEDIEKIADCVDERVRELIENHRPLDYEYVEYDYDVLSCDDRIMFKLIIVDGQPEITEAWLTYKDYDYCFGQINLDKINAKLTKVYQKLNKAIQAATMTASKVHKMQDLTRHEWRKVPEALRYLSRSKQAKIAKMPEDDFRRKSFGYDIHLINSILDKVRKQLQ